MLNDSLTVVVGLVAGVVLGVLAFVVFGFTTESVWVFAVAPLVWIGSTAVIARQRTVFGAVRMGCYATATLLACVPVIALGPATSGSLFGRLSAFLLSAIPFGLVALVVAGVGRWVGSMAPDES